VLSRVADLHRQHETELAELMTIEIGKPIVQAKAEVELSAAIYDYANSRPRLLADEILDIAGTGRAVVRTAPIGPLLGSMPWNYTCYQAARFVHLTSCSATPSCSSTPPAARSRPCGLPASSRPPAVPPGSVRTCSPPLSRWRS
jgi:Aldehyde dehydrogenase family